MQRPRIAILGSAPSSVMLAPFRDKNWQIWACSPANLQQRLPRIDVWFEMHSWSLDQKKTQNPQYYAWLKHQPRIIMQNKDPEWPGSVAYPLAEVRKRWPWGSRYFLTSTPAEMMALAILQNPEAIGLWGIDMAGHTEWQWQRPGMHYWMEKADELGIHLVTPGEADILCPPPVYGFCESTHMWRKLNARKRELERRMSVARETVERATKEALILQGANESTIYEMRTWLPDAVDPKSVPMSEEELAAQAKDQVARMTAAEPSKAQAPISQAEFMQALATAGKAMGKTKKVKKAANGNAKKNQAEKQTTHRGASGSLPPLDGEAPMGGSSAG